MKRILIIISVVTFIGPVTGGTGWHTYAQGANDVYICSSKGTYEPKDMESAEGGYSRYQRQHMNMSGDITVPEQINDELGLEIDEYDALKKLQWGPWGGDPWQHSGPPD